MYCCMVLNSIKNPKALNIVNELRMYANEVGGSISQKTEMGVKETTYRYKDMCIQLFERDGESYLKFTYESGEPDDIENYHLENIESIEFSRNPQCVHINYNGEFDEWGIDRTVE